MMSVILLACGLSAGETTFVELPLPTEAARAGNEYSSLAWHGDTLVLLSQEPDGFVFTASRESPEVSIASNGDTEVSLAKLRFDDGDLRRGVRGFDGYEAIAFDGDRAWLTIEAADRGAMTAWLAEAAVSSESIEVDETTLRQLPLKHTLPELSVESLIAWQGGVVAIAECNSGRFEGFQSWHVVGDTIAPMTGTTLPYRITDASAVNENNHVWLVNYWWTGEIELAETEDDRKNLEPVHRLIHLRLDGDEFDAEGIFSVDLPGTEAEQHNWEGVARWNDTGVLIVTDTYPRTVFGLVSW